MLTKHIVSPIIISAKAHKMQKHKKENEDSNRGCAEMQSCASVFGPTEAGGRKQNDGE